MEIKAVQFSNVCPSIFVTFSGIVIEDKAWHTKYLQPIITQYFIGNKSEIWSLSLIVHYKG